MSEAVPAVYDIYENLLSPREAQIQNQDLQADTGFKTEKQKRCFDTCLHITGNALLLRHKNKASKTELVQASASEATVLYLEHEFFFPYSEHFSTAAKPSITRSKSCFLILKPAALVVLPHTLHRDR